MSDSKKDKGGRRRVPLTQAMARWQGDEKQYIQRHIPRLIVALYREMIAFEPVGFVTHVHLARFMDKYNEEIRCLFSTPFNRITTPEQVEAQRVDVVGYIKSLVEHGVVPRREDDDEGYHRGLFLAFDVRQAEMAYQDALTYVWREQGGEGEPPTQPGSVAYCVEMASVGSPPAR